MEGTIISRKSIVSNRRAFVSHGHTRYPGLLAQLLDLKTTDALSIATPRGKKEQTSVCYMLRKLCRKEGLTLGWDRSTDYTVLYLWVEKAA